MEGWKCLGGFDIGLITGLGGGRLGCRWVMRGRGRGRLLGGVSGGVGVVE